MSRHDVDGYLLKPYLRRGRLKSVPRHDVDGGILAYDVDDDMYNFRVR